MVPALGKAPRRETTPQDHSGGGSSTDAPRERRLVGAEIREGQVSPNHLRSIDQSGKKDCACGGSSPRRKTPPPSYTGRHYSNYTRAAQRPRLREEDSQKRLQLWTHEEGRAPLKGKLDPAEESTCKGRVTTWAARGADAALVGKAQPEAGQKKGREEEFRIRPWRKARAAHVKNVPIGPKGGTSKAAICSPPNRPSTEAIAD